MIQRGAQLKSCKEVEHSLNDVKRSKAYMTQRGAYIIWHKEEHNLNDTKRWVA